MLNTLRKLRQITWAQVYRDAGLKWEKIDSVKPPQGIDAIYSLRITQGSRAPQPGRRFHAVSHDRAGSRFDVWQAITRFLPWASTGPRLGSEHRKRPVWAERQCGSESGVRSHSVPCQ